MSSQIERIRREPESRVLDGRDLEWLIDRHLMACHSRLERERTVTDYRNKLAWFLRWWSDYGPSHDWLLREEDMVEFERWLRTVVSERTGRPLSYHTRQVVTVRLREALGWAYEKGYMRYNYARWVINPLGGPAERRAAPAHLLWRLLYAAHESENPIRDRTILASFIGMGLRRSEVQNLNVEDIVIEADQSGTARITGKKTRARPSGVRYVAFDETTGRHLAVHMDALGYEVGPLFCSRLGGRLSAHSIYMIVKRAVHRAGLEDYIRGPHDLRRAFATHWVRVHRGEASGDLLRRQLGHAKFDMTTLYTLTDVEDIRASIVSPLQAAPKVE